MRLLFELLARRGGWAMGRRIIGAVTAMRKLITGVARVYLHLGELKTGLFTCCFAFDAM